MITQSALSLEYVSAAVTAKAMGAPVNPTSDPVAFAFTAVTEQPASGDWKTGSWDGTAPRAPGNAFVAQCLVGPGGTVALAPGRYTMWVRVTDSPEIPVIPVGLIRIT